MIHSTTSTSQRSLVYETQWDDVTWDYFVAYINLVECEHTRIVSLEQTSNNSASQNFDWYARKEDGCPLVARTVKNTCEMFRVNTRFCIEWNKAWRYDSDLYSDKTLVHLFMTWSDAESIQACLSQTLPCFQIGIKGKQSTHTSCYHCSFFLISWARCRHKIGIKGCFLSLLDSLCPPCEGARKDHVKRYISAACLRRCCRSTGYSQSLCLSSQASVKESKQPLLPKDGLFCPSQTKPSVQPWRSTPCFATDARPGQKQDYTGLPPSQIASTRL